MESKVPRVTYHMDKNRMDNPSIWMDDVESRSEKLKISKATEQFHEFRLQGNLACSALRRVQV